MNDIILVLSHRGQSFLTEWSRALEELNLQGAILASSPKTPEDEWRSALPPTFSQVSVRSEKTLTKMHVLFEIDRLQAEGFQVAAVVTVWEDYRAIAAWANEILSAPDLRADQVICLRDKLKVRENLKHVGLSKVECEILNRGNFYRYQAEERSKFIKPRFGIGSFATFRLKADETWDSIKDIYRQMTTDQDYADFFSQDSSLLIEDFIPGSEMSFEILVGGSESVVLAVHEKIEMENGNKAILETACVTPPPSVKTLEQISTAQVWIQNVVEALGIGDGIFHLEARLDRGRWELIEINPRMGGSFIFLSTLEISGHSLLKEWLRLLMTREASVRRGLINELRQQAFGSAYQNQAGESVFFRVFFAEGGKSISSITHDPNCPLPRAAKQFLTVGTEVPDVHREVFLAQALWKIPACETSLKEILDRSKTFFQVEYTKNKNLPSLTRIENEKLVSHC